MLFAQMCNKTSYVFTFGSVSVQLFVHLESLPFAFNFWSKCHHLSPRKRTALSLENNNHCSETGQRDVTKFSWHLILSTSHSAQNFVHFCLSSPNVIEADSSMKDYGLKSYRVTHLYYMYILLS